MRYVLINDLYSEGGAEIQSLRGKQIMEAHGDEVLYLTFDPDLPDGWDKEDKHHYNFTADHPELKKKIYKYVTDRKLLKRVKKIVDDFAPEFIHVNNTGDHSNIIYGVCREYKTIKTIHDYNAVCPKSTCIDKKKAVCSGSEHNNCLKKCMPDMHKRWHITLCAKYWLRKRLENRSVDLFVCPSMTLTKFCRKNRRKTYCINNSFDISAFESLKQREEKHLPFRYLYFGLVAEHKGIFELIDAFESFSDGKEAVLYIAGKIEKDCDEKFRERIASSSRVKYIGRLPYQQMLTQLSETDCVVVPSLWMENYPNTVLEGMSAGCIVLASNRGGMKEMLCDDRMIFDVLDKQDIISKLEFAYSLPADEIRQITERNYRRVRQNNSSEMYYRRFMELVSQFF